MVADSASDPADSFWTAPLHGGHNNSALRSPARVDAAEEDPGSGVPEFGERCCKYVSLINYRGFCALFVFSFAAYYTSIY